MNLLHGLLTRSVVNSQYANSFEEHVYDDTFQANPIIKRHHKHHINDKYATGMENN